MYCILLYQTVSYCILLPNSIPPHVRKCQKEIGYLLRHVPPQLPKDRWGEWAAKNTKNTVPAQPVPRQERRELYFFGQPKTPKTRFPLNVPRPKGNRTFEVLGSEKH